MATINKLLIASTFLSPTNHVVEGRTEDQKRYRSFCGQDFQFSDGYLDEQDSVQFARLCSRCVDKMKALKLPVPSRSIPGWHEAPYEG